MPLLNFDPYGGNDLENFAFLEVDTDNLLFGFIPNSSASRVDIVSHNEVDLGDGRFRYDMVIANPYTNNDRNNDQLLISYEYELKPNVKVKAIKNFALKITDSINYSSLLSLEPGSTEKVLVEIRNTDINVSNSNATDTSWDLYEAIEARFGTEGSVLTYYTSRGNWYYAQYLDFVDALAVKNVYKGNTHDDQFYDPGYFRQSSVTDEQKSKYQATFIGGLGDDKYYLLSKNTQVIEGENEGIDTIEITFGFDAEEKGWEYIENFTSIISSTNEAFALLNDQDNIFYASHGQGLLGDPNWVVDGRGGNDHLGANGGGSHTLIGGTGNDTIRGRAGNDVIIDSWGSDSIRASDGDDVIRAFEGGDEIFADAGADTVYGGRGDDTISGSWGDDVLYGDTIVFASSGDDILDGGSGDDTMQGGFGADTFIFYATDAGNNTIQRIDTQGADFEIGIDKIRLVDFGNTVTSDNIMDHWSNNAEGDAVFVSGDISIVLTGVSSDDLSTSDFVFI